MANEQRSESKALRGGFQRNVELYEIYISVILGDFRGCKSVNLCLAI